MTASDKGKVKTLPIASTAKTQEWITWIPAKSYQSLEKQWLREMRLGVWFSHRNLPGSRYSRGNLERGVWMFMHGRNDKAQTVDSQVYWICIILYILCIYIYIYIYILYILCITGLPCGSDSKESACNVGDLDSIPGLGRFPWRRCGYALQYSCQNPTDR